jgi:hypothetical protein
VPFFLVALIAVVADAAKSLPELTQVTLLGVRHWPPLTYKSLHYIDTYFNSPYVPRTYVNRRLAILPIVVPAA